MKLTELNWNEVEELVSNLITTRVRLYDDYNFVVVDDYTVIIKVYKKFEETGVSEFVIKAKLNEQKGELEIIDVM